MPATSPERWTREALLVAATSLLIACPSGGPGSDEAPLAPDGADGGEFERLVGLPYSGFAGSIATGASGVVLHLPEHTADGWSLYTNRDLCSARLVDARGDTVRQWRGVPCHRWSDAELLPDGDLVVVASEPATVPGDPPVGFLVRLSWSGPERWRSPVPAHHSIEVRPNGDILALAHRRRQVPSVSGEAPLLDSDVSVVSPDGELLESWSLYDALSGSPEIRLRALPPREKDGRKIVDLLHPNAIEWIPGGTQGVPGGPRDAPVILVTFRNQNLVAIFDWSRRVPVWFWGPGEIEGPHDARWLATGRVLLFDNGLVRGWSRVIEVDPATGGIAWEFRAPRPEDFFSATRGGALRLENGNTLVTSSDAGEAFELGPDGSVVWRFLNPDSDDRGHRSTVFKMKRYGRDRIERIRAATGG